MNVQQPEALRLADELDGTVKTGYWEAAAELRRLHEVNQELEYSRNLWKTEAVLWSEKTHKLHSVNAELLEALQMLLANPNSGLWANAARSAIAKATTN